MISTLSINHQREKGRQALDLQWAALTVQSTGRMLFEGPTAEVTPQGACADQSPQTDPEWLRQQINKQIKA